MRPFPFLLTLALGVMTLPACTASPPTMSDPTPPPTAGCNADAAKPAAMGKVATAAVLEQARIDSGSAAVRVIRPGEAVTMDFRGDRLDLNVNARNAIDGVKCG